MGDLINSIRELIKDYPVIFAYLFGSYATGMEGPQSDIDVAVYLDEADGDRRFSIRLRLIRSILTKYQIEHADVIILNDAPLRLYYNIIKSGIIIYSVDELKRIREETKVMSLYLDRKYYEERHTDIALSQIAKEGIL